MGRAPCCEKVGLKRGRWTAEEDEILTKYIKANGEGSWRSLPKNAGLLRCGKSCRLRWINYLRDDLKRGNISAEEETLIVKLHASFGNRWSLIASHLSGRTDNEIKNYWNSHLSRKIYTFRGTTTNYNNNIKEIPSQGILVNIPPKRKGGRISRNAIKKNKQYTQRVSESANWLSSTGEDTPNELPLPCIVGENIETDQNPNPKVINDDDLLNLNDIIIDTCEVEKERDSNDDEGVRDKTHDTKNNSVTCRSSNDLDWDSVVPLLNNKGQSLSWELTWLWDDDEWEKDFHKYTEIDPDHKQNAIFSWL
ncbi:unnamed protein product [Lathyrus oleraceus]|uniref:Uncharacterized protein n=1 Tax=Pisum sativum TaxID=3888 RepID=A0A9D5AWW1_PEA|nr:transcription repressor MYB6-like isoform X1 [Pisum sativum]KAI5424943.1 hypothetical protein KIW84_030929 [Pisum sativum]